MVSLLVYESGPFWHSNLTSLFTMRISQILVQSVFFNICCGGLTYLPKV